MKKVIPLMLALVMCLSLCACEDPASDVGAYKWPDSGICDQLPQPESDIGEIGYDSASMFMLDVYETTQSQYEAYIDACKDMGFTVDYYASSSYYDADNTQGYSLSLYYDSDEEIMSISLYAPSNEEDETEAPTEVPTEADTETPEGATEDGVTEPKEITPEETAPPTEATEATEPEEAGIRPEFKEAMDSYEAFFEEYCDFMKKYQKNPTDLSLLADYASYMSRYTEAMSKMEELDDGSLSDAELKYYTEVYARITKMLLEVAG